MKSIVGWLCFWRKPKKIQKNSDVVFLAPRQIRVLKNLCDCMPAKDIHSLLRIYENANRRLSHKPFKSVAISRQDILSSCPRIRVLEHT